jgi:hypothetical protein
MADFVFEKASSDTGLCGVSEKCCSVTTENFSNT